MLDVVICLSPWMVTVHKTFSTVSSVSWWTEKDTSRPRPRCSFTWFHAFLARKEQWRLLTGVKFKKLHLLYPYLLSLFHLPGVCYNNTLKYNFIEMLLPSLFIDCGVLFVLTLFIVNLAEVLFTVCSLLSCEVTCHGQQWQSLNTCWICGQKAGPCGSASPFREMCMGASRGCGKAEGF